MPLWDVFHSERLEAERSLTTEAVRRALALGELIEDDLVRPAGETRWVRLGDSPEFANFASFPPPTYEGEPSGPTEHRAFEPPSIDEDEEDDDEAESDLTRFEPDADPYASLEREALAAAEAAESSPFEPYTEFEVVAEDDDEPEPGPAPFEESAATIRRPPPVAEPPVLPDEETHQPDLPEIDDDFEEFDPQDEDEEAAEFTLSRNAAERIEELDLAAMVDVAFQLVLFFLVTAQVILYKTLEVPRPNEDKPPEAAAQGRSKSVDELEKDYILVEVDAAGAIKIDRQPVPADRATLVEKLRASRELTARKAMLLSADFATQHRNAVMVFDVANEIDLRIAIAQPSGKK